MDIKINKKDKGIVEIEGEISAEKFESYREQSFDYLTKGIELDGFRKGTAPKALLSKHVPEMHVLEEMANRAIGELYPQILTEHKIDAIGHPAVKIKKIATNNPLIFSLETAVLPVVVLPDYMKLVGTIKKDTPEKVTDEEIETTLLEVRKMRAHNEAHGEGPHEHAENEPEIPLPEMNDEFVQKLGDFKTVDEFKAKVTENLSLEKEGRAKSKTRAAIMETLASNTDIDVPDILVEYELDKFMEQMKNDVTRMGLSYEEYLKHLTKTEEEMRASYRADTIKKIKSEFILVEIAKKENIEADAEKVGEQVEGIMQAYVNMDRANVEQYVKNMLQNEAVIEFLESKTS
jgi:FKBP-type peptidyl-prolyl cis-trans isomerase (trigger factor)